MVLRAMTDNTEQEKRPLSLVRPGGRLELRKPIETGQVRQSFPHGRSKTVQVEVRKKRAVPTPDIVEPASPLETPAASASPAAAPSVRRPVVLPHGLTAEERAHRARALKGAIRADEEARRQAVLEAEQERELEALREEQETRRQAEDEARGKVEEESRRKTDEESRRVDDDARRKAEKAEEDSRREVAERAGKAAAAKVAALTAAGKVKPAEEETEEEAPAKRGLRPSEAKKAPAVARRDEPRRRTGKLTITKALNDDEGERQRSLASVRRRLEREKQRAHQLLQDVKIVREVVVPEHITVQELANRMAERGGRRDQDADAHGRDGDDQPDDRRRHGRARRHRVRPQDPPRLRGRCRDRARRRGRTRPRR